MMGSAIGIDIGGHGVKGVVIDEERRVIASARREISDREQRGIDAVEDRVAEVVRELDSAARAAGVEPERRIGCGIPGFHDRRSGLLRASPNFPGWEDQPVARRLEARIGRPVVSENDANCALLGEAWAGVARGHSDVVMLTLGTGVGAGFLVEGRLLRGAHGAGAEGGHLCLYPGGRRCGCGQSGCLEAYASVTGLLETTREAFWEAGKKGPLPSREPAVLFQMAAEEGAQHPWLVSAVERFAGDLAQGLASLVHLFQPEVIVLGGGLSRSFGRFQGPLEERLRSRTIPACLAGALPIRPAGAEESGAIGAAALSLGFGSH